MYFFPLKEISVTWTRTNCAISHEFNEVWEPCFGVNGPARPKWYHSLIKTGGKRCYVSPGEWGGILMVFDRRPIHQALLLLIFMYIYTLTHFNNDSVKIVYTNFGSYSIPFKLIIWLYYKSVSKQTLTKSRVSGPSIHSSW